MNEQAVGRRTAILGTAGALASLAGCVSTSSTPPGSGSGGGSGGDQETAVLRLGGSSTVYPIVNRAAAFWTSNRPATDAEYWGPGEYGIRTDERLADYWAGQYGFESLEGSQPPFDVNVGLSHSGTGLEKLRNGQVDIGNASAPVTAELPDLSESELEKFVDHVVGVDAQPIVVSTAVYEAGVQKLTAEQVRSIYRGEITNWIEIDAYDGPDAEIQVVGRAVGSGTDTAFRSNMLGDPEAEMPGVDIRKGENQQVKTLVGRSDNAIAYMALAFVDDSVPAISLEFEDETYVPGENLSDPGYPLARDLHCYTYEGTSKKEAAFLRMVLSDFGQDNFVRPTGYATLTTERQRNQMDALPEPTA